jgi:hypothetical protein
LNNEDLAMRDQMSMETQTKWAVVAIAIVALVGIVSPQAFADNIGAPTSAAGGLSAPSSPSLSGAAGPLDSTSGSSAMGGPNDRFDQNFEPSRLSPGTGKFEGPNNGTNTPCLGTTGFGSSNGIPGRKC